MNRGMDTVVFEGVALNENIVVLPHEALIARVPGTDVNVTGVAIHERIIADREIVQRRRLSLPEFRAGGNRGHFTVIEGASFD